MPQYSGRPPITPLAPQKSDRADGTAGRTTQGDESLRDQNHTRGLPEIPEARRIDTGPLEDSLAAMERMRLELGTTPRDLIGGELEDARVDLMAGLKLADKYGERDLHLAIGQVVLALDDIREGIAKARGSE